MSYREKKKSCQPLMTVARAFVISGVMSIIAIAEASAQPQPLEPDLREPNLRELIDTIPARRTDSPLPVSESERNPAETVFPSASETAPPKTPAETIEQAVKLTLRLSERRVYVYTGDVLTASYPVAVGRAGWETPTGEFEVFHQLVDPGWTNPITGEAMPPGPNNPLGDRWIAFWTDGNNSIGFHGTPNRESVGRAASHGCIRMYNEDVRELYEIVSVGTPVTVIQ